MELLRRIRCFLQGHPARPTGRDLAQLRQMWCPACRQLFVANPADPQNQGALLPWDSEAESFFRECEQQIAKFEN